MLVQSLSVEMFKATAGMTPLVILGDDPDNQQKIALSHATITVTSDSVLLSGQDNSGQTWEFNGNETVVFQTC